MIGRKEIFYAFLAAGLVLGSIVGCAQNKKSPEATATVKSTSPSEEPPKLSPEEKQFNAKIADPAKMFAEKSHEIYTSTSYSKPKKPWWTILWPWGQNKKGEQRKMDLKNFKFTATYPNAKK